MLAPMPWTLSVVLLFATCACAWSPFPSHYTTGHSHIQGLSNPYRSFFLHGAGSPQHSSSHLARRDNSVPDLGYNTRIIENICAPQYDYPETFQCVTTQDCFDVDASRTGISTFNYRSPFGITADMNRFLCLNNTCVKTHLGQEGDDCSNSVELSPSIYPGTQCEYPLTCSSGKCQLPLAAGCGPCNGDPNACLPGLFCDTFSNNCTSSLSIGSQCVFPVYATRQIYNPLTQKTEVNNVWVDSILPCGVSFADNVVDQFSYCDVTTQRCVEPEKTIPVGQDCNGRYGSCVENAACIANNSGTVPTFKCMEIGSTGDSCIDSQLCSSTDVCVQNSDYTSNCVQLGSLKEGDRCSIVKDYSEQAIATCSPGLVCNINGICQKLKSRGLFCKSSRDCQGLDMCVGNFCVGYHTQGTNQSCDPFSSISVCQPGYQCEVASADSLTGFCVNRITDSHLFGCSINSDCSNDISGDTACMCANTTLIGENVKVCQTVSSDVQNSALFDAAHTCLNQIGYNLETYLTLPFTMDKANFLCCMADKAPFIGDPFFTSDILKFTFGFDNFIPNCAGTQSYFAGKPKDFCSTGPNLDFLTGVKSLLKVPSATVPYSGVDTNLTRYTLSPSDIDPVACGIEYCNGRGYCIEGSNLCYCDSDAWGDSCQWNEEDRYAERVFLADLFLQTRGCAWTVQDGWTNETSDYCNWFGIRCEDWLIDSIQLPFNNLRGSIPESISNLRRITSLNLEGNFLEGPLPSSIYMLESLSFLDLSQNRLEGPIFQEIMFLNQLRQLILWGNNFSGSIPWSLGYMENLRILLLHENSFEGELPWSFANLVNVTAFDLSSNNFTYGSYLPFPLCSRCSRVFVKSADENHPEPFEGYLMTCSSPNSFMPALSGNVFQGPVQPLPEMHRILRDIPETCIYKFS